MHCVSVNLSYRDLVPEFMINEDKKTEEFKIMLALLLSHCLNYNTFLTTLVVQPTIVLVSAYIMLQK